MVARGHKIVGTAVVVGASVALVGIGMYRKPLAIRYHKWRVRALVNEEPKIDLEAGLSYYDNGWCRAFEKHQNRLVQLGFLEEREFALSNIKGGSEEYHRLWQVLEEASGGKFNVAARGWEPNASVVITVFDEPERLAEWEKLISTHDALAGEDRKGY
jgi:hypothetical protein